MTRLASSLWWKKKPASTATGTSAACVIGTSSQTRREPAARHVFMDWSSADLNAAGSRGSFSGSTITPPNMSVEEASSAIPQLATRLPAAKRERGVFEWLISHRFATYRGYALAADSISVPSSLEDMRAVLDKRERLSRSCLWRLQRAFFNQYGLEAWSEGIVPHYVTSNPRMAAAYARLVLDFLHASPTRTSQSSHVYIVELGAGSGRFAYRFLKKFRALQPAGGPRVTYVMTD